MSSKVYVWVRTTAYNGGSIGETHFHVPVPYHELDSAIQYVGDRIKRKLPIETTRGERYLFNPDHVVSIGAKKGYN